MEPNQSSGNWKKKKKGKALVYGAKNYYSVVEHEQWDNQEKKKTVQFNGEITDFGINQIWAQVSTLLLNIEGCNNY